ncbi:MAG: phenylacetic acid degradation operon negative regulatory protein PaaX [Halioglobus sp.]
MTQAQIIKRLVSGFTARRPMRTTSLIITIFGDVASQHGGSIWLGSLVRVMAPLGVNERLVRTSVFRLVKEGWLEFERVGRRSYYRFTEYGSHEYQRAARRIYAMDDEAWNGRWQILVPLELPDEVREKFRRSLHWQGFRTITSGTFAKPGSGGRMLLETLDEFDAAGRVLVLDADTLPQTPPRLLREMVQEFWHLDEVATDYREFLKRFKPLFKALAQGKEFEPESAFIARTLLIHDFRRVLLQDTPIPEELLPKDWPGTDAVDQTGQAYLALADASIDFICAELEGENGVVGRPAPEFAERYARA